MPSLTWLPIPSGTATLGSPPGDPQALLAEYPAHTVEVAAFYLACCPVTNLDFRSFIEAGGYAEARWWTPAGWQWRLGLTPDGGPIEEILELRHYFLSTPDELERRVARGRMLPETAEQWRAWTNLTDAQALAKARRDYPNAPRTRPAFWDDPRFNQAEQPVSGVAWHEAMAYCAWLHGELADRGDLPATGAGGRVRLPTEAEWEWAAGGPAHTRFPWGEAFDIRRANTLEGRALRPTPVDAYPAGASTHGALDMSGNVWEWCRTLFRPYPYRADDGREDPLADGKRVLRGGSWFNNQRGARVADRKYDRPVYRPNNFGFRLVLGPD